MMKRCDVPEKHLAAYDAFQSGKEIVFCSPYSGERWFSCPLPSWSPDTKYRVVENSTIRYIFAYLPTYRGKIQLTNSHYTEDEFKEIFNDLEEYQALMFTAKEE